MVSICVNQLSLRGRPCTDQPGHENHGGPGSQRTEDPSQGAGGPMWCWSKMGFLKTFGARKSSLENLKHGVIFT